MNFVNANQDKGERKFKYQILKNINANVQLRRRCRDWTWGHITLLIRSNNFNKQAGGEEIGTTRGAEN